MFIVTLVPEVDPSANPGEDSFEPLDPRVSLYSQLFETKRKNSLATQHSGSEPVQIRLTKHLHLRCSIKEYAAEEGDDPISVLIGEWNKVRVGSDPLVELTIPGQTYHTSLLDSTAPSEGLVAIICDSVDWPAMPPLPSWPAQAREMMFDFDPTPELEMLNLAENPRDSVEGSWISVDGRGLILHAADFQVHDTADLALEEAFPALVDLARGHTLRTYDVAAAARIVDEIRDASTTAGAGEMRISELRRIQTRITQRSIESQMELRQWLTASGDDALRLRHRLAGRNAAADREVAATFATLQPFLESVDEDVRASERAESARREQRVEKVTRRAGAAIAGAALVGLFAALAAIPQVGATFQPYLRAAFATIIIAVMIGALAWVLEAALTASAGTNALRASARILGAAAVVIGLALAAWGWFADGSGSVALLVGTLGCLSAGLTLVLWTVPMGRARPSAHNERANRRAST